MCVGVGALIWCWGRSDESMSAIIRYSCNQCPYSQEGIESYLTVIMANGIEEICPHPGEKRGALARTHRSWWQLVSENRLRIKCALLCLSCGHLDYYPMIRSSTPLVYRTNIYYRPSVEEALSYPCTACQSHNLYPLCGPQIGCLSLLLRAFRLKSPEPDKPLQCPKCEKGSISGEMVAIT